MAELSMDKFQYNLYHPLISFLPIGAFVVLRNANDVLRSASSTVFAFVGRCSLETFIIQYHLWLAGDTKGVLLVLPGTRWRPLNMVVTTVIFIYVSHHVAKTTAELTKWICDEPELKSLASLPPPASAPDATDISATSDREVIFEVPAALELPVRKEDAEVDLPPHPDTPVRPSPRWVDRLAEGTSPFWLRHTGIQLRYGQEWRPGLKSKLLGSLVVLWILNLLWSYPP